MLSNTESSSFYRSA